MFVLLGILYPLLYLLPTPRALAVAQQARLRRAGNKRSADGESSSDWSMAGSGREEPGGIGGRLDCSLSLCGVAPPAALN